MPATSPLNHGSHLDCEAYWVTIRTYENESLFGHLKNGCMELNMIGQIVAESWMRSSVSHQSIEIDHWHIMPDQVRGIVLINPQQNNTPNWGVNGDGGGKPRTLSAFIAGFKAGASKRINLIRNQPGLPVWQKGYREQRLANIAALEQARQRILQLSLLQTSLA